MTIPTSDIRRLEKGNSKDDSTDDKQKANDTLRYVCAFELLQSLEIFTEPTILFKLSKTCGPAEWNVVHTSITENIALKPTPTMKTSKNMRCSFGKRLVSKIERNSSPNPPIKPQIIASTLKTRSRVRIFGISLTKEA